MENIETVAEQTNLVPVNVPPVPVVITLATRLQQLADLGTQKWRKTVQAIMETGQFLIHVKEEEVDHGEFSQLFTGYKGKAKAVTSPMPFQLPFAEKLMRIARHPVLSNSTNWSNLPTAVSTLDLLTQFSKEDLERYLSQGKVTPETTADQVRVFLYYGTGRERDELKDFLTKTKARQKKSARRAVAECNCMCARCGNVHTDVRLIARTGQPAPALTHDGAGS